MSRPVVEFWFEFASTYSYLSVMRIERAAEAAGVDIEWKPFLLGPVRAPCQRCARRTGQPVWRRRRPR